VQKARFPVVHPEPPRSSAHDPTGHQWRRQENILGVAESINEKMQDSTR
jgi:hypothetical protein